MQFFSHLSTQFPPSYVIIWIIYQIHIKKTKKGENKKHPPTLKSVEKLGRYGVDCQLQNSYTCLYMYVSLSIHFVKKTYTRKYTKIITMNLILYPFLFFFRNECREVHPHQIIKLCYHDPEYSPNKDVICPLKSNDET